MVFEFASTSKITLPGAGVACFACSEANMEYMEKLINVQIISYDKINQLRHVKYLKDKAHTLELMKKHAAIMGPKFKAVTETLAREVGPLGLATWHDPRVVTSCPSTRCRASPSARWRCARRRASS